MDSKDQTFSVREGEFPESEPLPLKQLSKALRNELWSLVHDKLYASIKAFNLNNNWEAILSDYHVHYLHKPVDEFKMVTYTDRGFVKKLLLKGSYNRVFDFLEWVLNHPSSPGDLKEKIDQALDRHRAAYSLQKGPTRTQFVIRSLEGGVQGHESAMQDLGPERFSTVRDLMTQSTLSLREGNKEKALQASVEALVALMDVFAKDVSEDFLWALEDCSKKWRIQPAFLEFFQNIFHYKVEVGKEQHFLLENVEDLDDLDVWLFHGFCLSFISYLIQKERRSYRNISK